MSPLHFNSGVSAIISGVFVNVIGLPPPLTTIPAAVRYTDCPRLSWIATSPDWSPISRYFAFDVAMTKPSLRSPFLKATSACVPAALRVVDERNRAARHQQQDAAPEPVQFLQHYCSAGVCVDSSIGSTSSAIGSGRKPWRGPNTSSACVPFSSMMNVTSASNRTVLSGMPAAGADTG
jgi:hypothetical protein